MNIALFDRIRRALRTETKNSGAAAAKKRLALRGEQLEPRQMMSVTAALSVLQLQSLVSLLPPQPTAAGRALINGLGDATIRSTALTDYNRDGYLTRNDMIQLFQVGSNQYATINSTEVRDLQTLIGNATTVGMPGYVQNLASKTLYDSSAYTFYATGQLNYAWYNPSYYVFDNIGAITLGQQVNNWFLGQVRPDPVLLNSDGSVAVNAAYRVESNLPLFAAGGPSYQDVQQGQVGDCWLLSSLAEVAVRNPSAITSMFINNGDGTYTVRFYNNGTPDYVTVDDNLPSVPQLNWLHPVPFSATYDKPLTDMWVALAEKAYAEECGSGWIGTNKPGSDSYQALNFGDPQWALAAITGKPAADFTVTNQIVYPTLNSINNVSSIVTAWTQGKYIVLGTPGTGSISSGIQLSPPPVVPNHAYAVVGYNSTTGIFTLFNPWGTGGGYLGSKYYAGTFSGTAAAVAAYFSYWSQCGTAASVPSANAATTGQPSATHSTAVEAFFAQTGQEFAAAGAHQAEFAGGFAADDVLLAAIGQGFQPHPGWQGPRDAVLADLFAREEFGSRADQLADDSTVDDGLVTDPSSWQAAAQAN